MCSIDWAALGQWLQLGLQALIVAFTFPYVKRQVAWAKEQVDEARKARELSATREIINEIGTEEVRELRHWLLHECKEPLTPDSDPDALKKAQRVAVAYDRVGYMVKQRLVPEIALFTFQETKFRSYGTA